MTDRDEAIRRVTAAWDTPRKNPIHHRAWQNRLRRDWPALASALDALSSTENAERGRS